MSITASQLEQAGRALASESARFAGLGWMRGTSGNLSVVVDTDPLLLAVTISGKDKGELTSGDIVIVDRDGKAVADQPNPHYVPSAEAQLHAIIAAETGAGAVVHVHALPAVLAAHRWPEGPVLRDLEMLKGIGRSAHDEDVRFPVVDNDQDMTILGESFLATYDKRTPVILVKNHGMYAWGKDLLQARHHAEITEWLLRFHLETA
jgi:methylthioribulose-1-phosphate dehydratase